MAQPTPNHIYQYSLVNALMAGISSSGITVSTLLSKGNHGLGTFVSMDGELVLLDNTVYQLQSGGQIREASPTDQIPYAMCTWFEAQQTLSVTLDHKDAIDQILKDREPHGDNLFMAYRVTGKFSYCKARTVKKADKDNQTLAELAERQFVAEYKDVAGTVIGFRCPEAWQGFFVAGEHLHFISDDRTFGGHVLEIEAKEEVKFEISRIKDVHIELPEGKRFNEVDLVTDDAGLKKAEG